MTDTSKTAKIIKMW